MPFIFGLGSCLYVQNFQRSILILDFRQAQSLGCFCENNQNRRYHVAVEWSITDIVSTFTLSCFQNQLRFFSLQCFALVQFSCHLKISEVFDRQSVNVGNRLAAFSEQFTCKHIFQRPLPHRILKNSIVGEQRWRVPD